MSKPSSRALSRYSRDALALLGSLIRLARIERKITAGELAERAGISRALLQRIEKGDPGCAVGAVFEAASLAGVSLFGEDLPGVHTLLNLAEEKLTLLPASVRRASPEVKDDF